MLDTKGSDMFKKVKGNNFILDEDVSNEIYIDVNNYLDSDASVDMGVRDNTLKLVIAHKVGLLVNKHINDELVRNGFITVQFTGTINFEITVAYINDELAYGVLVK